jgi:hypothetical protein
MVDEGIEVVVVVQQGVSARDAAGRNDDIDGLALCAEYV